MEFVRRPSILAAVAAALLVLNVVALQDDGSATDQPVIEDTLGDSAGEDAAEDTTEGDAAEDTDGDASEGADDATDDATDDAADGEATDGDAADGDATEEGDDAEGERGAIVAPSAGAYTYASSGSWSLEGPDPVAEQLPASATATVTGGGADWAIELVAGPKYADRFTFGIGSAGGLDWDGWELDRDFGDGVQTTTYTCSGDAAYYVNDAAVGRTSQHGCDTTTAASSGTIEYVGTEDVTLGDGTVVTADRLLYTYTVTGTGVTGDGRLDLWLDPATGLRVREQRKIDTVTSSGGIDYVYAEDVEFVLQSLTAS